VSVGQRIHNVRRKCKLTSGCPCGDNPVESPEAASTSAASLASPPVESDLLAEFSPLAEDPSQSQSAAIGGVDQESQSAGADSNTHVIDSAICFSARVAKRNAKGSAPSSGVSLPADVMECGRQPEHCWLDDGHLLQLLNPDDSRNLGLFREHWSKGVPIIISNCDRNLDAALWHPDAFCKNFGSFENELVDCGSNSILKGQKMRRFWEGFECVAKRLRDKCGDPLILKLKDWPATEDFAKMLPDWFDNLLKALPLPEYTHRAGTLNLVSRLPGFFVRPDLGPKMYNAYGSALAPRTGSTNLHLDVSDAVNLMVYVGIPHDEEEKHATGLHDIQFLHKFRFICMNWDLLQYSRRAVF